MLFPLRQGTLFLILSGMLISPLLSIALDTPSPAYAQEDNSNSGDVSPAQEATGQFENLEEDKHVDVSEYKGLVIQLNDDNNSSHDGKSKFSSARSTANDNAKIVDQFDDGHYLVQVKDIKDITHVINFYNSTGEIEQVGFNFLREKDTIPNDPKYPKMWHLNNDGSRPGSTPDADIDAPEAWDSTAGDCSDVVVGIMDSGIDITHPDLANNIWTNENEVSGDGIDNDGNGYVDDIHGYDFADNDSNIMPDVATDSSATHGTHVAGIIGAEGNNLKGVAGVCWNVKMVALKIFNSHGAATIFDIAEAAQYAVHLKESGVNLKVINMSFGSGRSSTVEFDAMNELRQAGILITISAGNQGTSAPRYPAAYPLDNIISVAASNDNDRLASFSSYNTNKVDIASPGVAILSTVVGDKYEFWSGTSMSAPQVAGTAALVSASNPSLNFAEIRAKIIAGADELTQLKGKVATSARLNVFGALNADPSLPDLRPANIKITSNTTTQETIKIIIKNTGGVQSDASFVKLYRLSSPPTAVEDIDYSSATLLGTFSVQSLAPNESQGISVTINKSNHLYLVAVVDYNNYIYEVDESNNVFAKTVSLKSNRAPVADAGKDQKVNEGDQVVLDGSKSSDPDGDKLTYEWKQISGLAVSIKYNNEAQATFVAPSVSEIKTLKFQLTISDGEISKTDTVEIKVRPN